MDVVTYFNAQNQYYSAFTGQALIAALCVKEYVEIELRKDELFFKRVDFICMARSLKFAMERESGYKQLKRYLVAECGMTDADAQHNTDKYNVGCRIHDKFQLIVNNCAECTNIDIRDDIWW